MAARDLQQVSTPTLLRSARGAYAREIRAQLEALGVDDLPRNGAFVMAGISATGGLRTELAGDLGVTKQAVGQAIDVLVGRGYLERAGAEDDRRRVVLKLTERGERVLDAVVRAVETVDAELLERVSLEQVTAMREGLAALIGIKQIKQAGARSAAESARRPRQLRRFSPIFPVRDVAAALAHYAALGFETSTYASGDAYGFADRDGLQLHLAAEDIHPRVRGGATYLYVRDADALYAEWSRPGIPGETRPVEDTPYGLREGSHVDPDGNLIRFGSPIPE